MFTGLIEQQVGKHPDGLSLTINTVDEANMPHTIAQTTLGQIRAGKRRHVKFDYFTRIVAHQLTVSGQMKGEVEL
jgi:riboflavin synthase